MKQPLATQQHLHEKSVNNRFALDAAPVISRFDFLTRTNQAASWIAGVFLVFALAFAVAPASADSAVSKQQTSIVNINTADAATLAQRLRGVGQSRAQEIVRHREAFGPFASAEELLEVKGIGQSTLEQNRARITLE